MTDRRIAFAGMALATVLGAWLRTYRLAEQVVLDDEWHAIHKLMNAGAVDILGSFGQADHSIPLTLFYKALAATIGLDEIDMRAVQVACGIALIVVAGGFAWRLTANAWVATLSAFLVAGAPFLVLYSRIARPYAITTLLTVLAIGAIWRWRRERSWGPGAGIAALAALSAWLHPLSGLFPAAAIIALVKLDLGAPRGNRMRLLGSSVLLGACTAAAMTALLIYPLIEDFDALSVKAGRTEPTAYTLVRVAGIFSGGFDYGLTAVVLLLAAFGAWTFRRARPEAASYLALTALVPVLVVLLLGADWTQQGHTFGRYIFPVQVLFLCSVALGAVSLVERIPGRAPWMAPVAVAALTIAYLALNPAIRQVRKLGPWYGHVYHTNDYVARHNRSVAYFRLWEVPMFYRELGTAAAGSTPIIEAPFRFEAPWNPFAYYALAYRQPELMGFLHDTCYEGPYAGEVPRDARFRFRNFVFLDDRAAVLASPARYLVLNRDLLDPARSEKCLGALTGLYGEPARIDGRVAVFDLQAARRVSRPVE
jgi:hypothetical protein